MKKIIPLKEQVRQFELAVIRSTLAALGNNAMQAAAALGVHVATLTRKIAADK